MSEKYYDNFEEGQSKEDYYANIAKQIKEENEEIEEQKSKRNKKTAIKQKEEEIEEIPNIKHAPEDEIDEYKILNEEIEPEPEMIYHSDKSIFPDGPLLSQIEDWKSEYPSSDGYKINLIDIDNISFVFRTLNRFEYKQIINLNLSATAREEAICNTVTLWPENYTHKAMASGPAGIPSSYSSAIMQESGFVKDFSITKL